MNRSVKKRRQKTADSGALNRFASSPVESLVISYQTRRVAHHIEKRYLFVVVFAADALKSLHRFYRADKALYLFFVLRRDGEHIRFELRYITAERERFAYVFGGGKGCRLDKRRRFRARRAPPTSYTFSFWGLCPSASGCSCRYGIRRDPPREIAARDHVFFADYRLVAAKSGVYSGGKTRNAAAYYQYF